MIAILKNDVPFQHNYQTNGQRLWQKLVTYSNLSTTTDMMKT